MTQNQNFNPIIKVYLDELFSETGIDPTYVSPDYKLGHDLGLSRTQIQVILARSAAALGIAVEADNCLIDDVTSRKMVEILSYWSCNASLVA